MFQFWFKNGPQITVQTPVGKLLKKQHQLQEESVERNDNKVHVVQHWLQEYSGAVEGVDSQAQHQVQGCSGGWVHKRKELWTALNLLHTSNIRVRILRVISKLLPQFGPER